MTILDRIVDEKKEEVKKLRSEFSYRSFSDFEFFERHIFSLKAALTSSPDLSIIAEIKKASPSAGVIRKDFDPVKLAKIYLESGADAISILTDRQFFQGSRNYLHSVAEFRTAPLLRKDFIIDELQVFEAKAFGADAVLLISEILSRDQVSELSAAASEVGLEVLIELHGADQISKIDFTHNTLIGINNRNLNDFSVSLETTEKITHFLPGHVVKVSESGIHGQEQVTRLKKMAVDAILIGEFLMRSEQIDKKLSDLKKWCTRAD